MSPTNAIFHLELARVQRELAAAAYHEGARLDHLKIALYHDLAAMVPDLPPVPE